MTDIFARAIPVVEPPVKGVHLMWTGPPEFVYAPGGWRIERRNAVIPSRIPAACDVITEATIKGAEELRLTLGLMLVTPGLWPGPEGGPCTVCTLELNPVSGGIHGVASGFQAFLYGLRNGKAVGFAGPFTGVFDLGSVPMDKLVIYFKPLFGAPAAANFLRICRYQYDKDDWTNAKLLATLQVPIKQLMPALTTPALELAEAKRRLLPGETIEAARFRDFMNLIRGIANSPPGFPIQDTILVRSTADDEFDELCLLDPIRMVYMSPLWRRALGFSYFDSDPALVANQQYDYRITGVFPSGTPPALFGFHTIPSGTALPVDFYLRDCHFRLPAPCVVSRAPGVAQTGKFVATRRGIKLEPQPSIPWINGLLDQYSAVIDLPSPATSVGFELETGHQLKVEGGFPWGPFTSAISVPPGPEPNVIFPQPVTQLRISGRGFLFSIRVPGGALGGGLTPIPIVISPVSLVNTPAPPPPVSARASSLQAAAHFTSQARSIPPRPLLGIDLRWQPASIQGLQFWPPQETAPPPLEVTSFQVERRIEPSGPWQPVVGGDNLILGSRVQPHPDTTIRPGVDMMELYPESRGPGSLAAEFTYTDVFTAPITAGSEGTATPKPPAPGTILKYRVRAIDIVGRPSTTWTETDPVRLEKHEAPPLPSAPSETPADTLPSAAPSGVNATVLVRGMQGLTAEETSLLGANDNVIVLRWGWHAKQRKLDPFAKQFRLYLARPLDEVSGAITAAPADAIRPGVFHVSLALDRSAAVDAAAGQYLDAGYPFFIETHTGGTNIQATVRTTIAKPGGGFRTPALGPVILHLKYSNQLTRASGWMERLRPSAGQKFVPITAAQQYQVVIPNRLVLTEAHPKDTLWIGVTAADDQAYVPDTFTGVNPGGPLPGNESGVASTLCQGKRYIRPDYQPPPPIGPVARVIAPEPVNGPIQFHLDLTPFLTGSGLPGGGLVQHERLHSVDLLSAFGVVSNQLVARPVNGRAGETPQPITIANPGDRAAIVQAITTGHFETLDDRFLALLARLHPFRDRLFQPVSEDPVSTLDFDESLPSVAARYVYRVRRANGAGQLSLDGAVPQAVVHVPSPIPGPAPEQEQRRPADPAKSLRFHIPENSRLTHLLVFRNPATEQAGAQILRTPNRPDLFPAGHIRLRLDAGPVLTPAVIPLSTLEHNAQGWSALVQAEPPGAGPVRVWVASLTSDGIPSELGGPCLIPFTPPPPPAPTLSGGVVSTGLHFTWVWPGSVKAPVTLERSADGVNWQRVSPPIGVAQASFNLPPAGAARSYRLRVQAATLVVSNVIVI